MKFNWKEVCKFLSGAFFVGALSNWYLSYRGIGIPFFGWQITPGLLALRGCVQFALSMLTFYVGYLRTPKLQG